MNDETLLPCPFCGGEVSITYTDQVDAVTFCAHIECDGCDIDFARQYGAPNAQIAEEEAISAWNTRAQASAPDGGEAVAYRYSAPDDTGWSVCLSRAKAEALKDDGFIVEPLYTRSNAKAGEVDDAEKYRELCRQMDDAKPVSNEASTLRNILDDSINMGSACMDWHLEHALSLSAHDKTKA